LAKTYFWASEDRLRERMGAEEKRGKRKIIPEKCENERTNLVLSPRPGPDGPNISV